MANPNKVAGFRVDPDQSPRLWKAQHTFISAQMLQNAGHYDCAANRYYYTMIHVAYAYVREPDERKERWQHGDLLGEYVRNHDRQAQEACSRSQSKRDKADYSPIRVTDKDIAKLIEPVTESLIRALRKMVSNEN